jgi:hypothetical protein
LIRAQRQGSHPEAEGTIPGNVEAISTGAAGDAYVMIKKRYVKGSDGGEGNNSD